MSDEESFEKRLKKAIETVMEIQSFKTKTEFANFMGVALPQVSKWESGSQQITAPHLATIARISGISCDDLLLGEADANKRRRSTIAKYEASRQRHNDDYFARMRHYDALSTEFGFEIHKQFMAQCEKLRIELMDVESDSFNKAVLGRGQLTLEQLWVLEGLSDRVLLIGKPSLELFERSEFDGISTGLREYFYLCEHDDDLEKIADRHFEKLSTIGPLSREEYARQTKFTRCNASFPFADFFLHRIARDVELPREYEILLKRYIVNDPCIDLGDRGRGQWIAHICISPDRDHHLLLDPKRIARAMRVFWSLWGEYTV